MMIEKLEVMQVQDSSKIQDYLTCERLYFFKHVLGFTSEEPIHDLVFGSSFHKAKAVLLLNRHHPNVVEMAYNAFLKEYRETYGEETDVDFHPKSPGNAELALKEYLNDYKHDNMEVLYVEIGITVPISNKEVLYGKMDSVILDKVRGLISLETKTAKALWPWWQESFLQKFQTAAYTHFLYSYFADTYPIHGVIVDGTVFRKSGNENVRLPVILDIKYLENWLYDANRIVDNIKKDFALLDTVKEDAPFMCAFLRRTESCIKYNRVCNFIEVCHAWHNPLQKLDRIPAGYKVEYWDPRKEEVTVKLEVPIK